MAALFWGLVGFLVVERLAELPIAARNQERLVQQGAAVVDEDGFAWLFLVHVAWFLGLGAEYLWAPWAGVWSGTWFLLGGFVLGEALRLWAIGTLGRRWTTRVVVLPGASLVDRGPYRFLAHPNYVALGLVLAFVPLAFGLWVTAGVVSVANLAALRYRIGVEEAALSAAGGV